MSSAMVDDPPDAMCESCGEGLDAGEINVEAFELSGKVLCPDCAAELFEERVDVAV